VAPQLVQMIPDAELEAVEASDATLSTDMRLVISVFRLLSSVMMAEMISSDHSELFSCKEDICCCCCSCSGNALQKGSEAFMGDISEGNRTFMVTAGVRHEFGVPIVS
jgi:hypothetical protein